MVMSWRISSYFSSMDKGVLLRVLQRFEPPEQRLLLLPQRSQRLVVQAGGVLQPVNFFLRLRQIALHARPFDRVDAVGRGGGGGFVARGPFEQGALSFV